MKNKHIIAVLLLYLALSGCRMYLPPIKGTVLHENSKNPIKEAYVICFNERYPISQIINLGGPNSYRQSINFTKTNDAGWFKLSSYWAISLAYGDTRDFYIYKPGYSVLRYHQSGLFSYDDLNEHPWSKRIPFKRTFFIGNNFKEFDPIVSLAGQIEMFAKDLKYSNKTQFNEYRPFFEELYKEFLKDSDRVKESLKDYVANNWTSTLANLKESLENVK